MFRLLIIILCLVVFVIESTLVKGDACNTNETGKPGNCTFLDECTTLDDSMSMTIYGRRRGGKILVCCPFPAAPDTSSQSPDISNQTKGKEGDECIVATTRKPGNCTSVNDCEIVPDPLETTVCSHEGGKKIICCPLPTSEGRMCGQQKCISEMKCDEYYPALSCTKGMITDGEEAELKEFPHMALLGYKDRTGQIHWRCGGSLISEQYILTSASCVQGTQVIISEKRRKKIINLARLGEHDYEENNNERQDFGFTIIQHPAYNTSAKQNNIALLKLTEIVSFTEFIRPACLPTTFTPHRPDGIVTGWGTTEFMGPTSSKLLKASLEFYSYNDCSERYASHGVTVDNITQICAVDKTKDACQGDTGGPLQTFHPVYECMYIVNGVISFGILCGKNVPGVYDRVFSYLEWIENEVWGNNLNVIDF